MTFVAVVAEFARIRSTLGKPNSCEFGYERSILKVAPITSPLSLFPPVPFFGCGHAAPCSIRDKTTAAADFIELLTFIRE